MAALPKIFVVVPGVEDLRSIASLLCLAGARITDRRREFVIEGPLTPARAAAVADLVEFDDGNSDGNQLDIRVDPPGDVAAALRVMCPEGPGRAMPLDWERVDRVDGIRWWDEQQGVQRAMRTGTTPSGNTAAQTARASAGRDAVCCGKENWSPGAGKPVGPSCALCADSPTYWRRPENRPDGREYVPVKALDDPDPPIVA